MFEELEDTNAGCLEIELQEIDRLDEADESRQFSSITVGCGSVLSLICC